MPSISSKALIGSAITRFGINTPNFASNAIEWIGEGIGLIGYHTGFETNVVELNVCDCRSSLPCGYVTHLAFLYKGKRLDRRNDSPAYNHPERYRGRNEEGNSALDPFLLELQKTLEVREKVYNLPKGEDREIAIQRTEFEIKSNADFLIAASKENRSECEWYYMEEISDIVQYSFESGKVTLIYEGFKVDSEGYPLIVDRPKYQECLRYLLLLRVMEGGYKHPVLSYDRVLDQYMTYLAQARNEPLLNNMMDDKMDQFTELWTGQRFNVGLYANDSTNQSQVWQSGRR